MAEQPLLPSDGMNASDVSQHVLDNFTFEMVLAAKLVEAAILPLLAAFVVGMYRGIEINHPSKNNYNIFKCKYVVVWINPDRK
jgi:hypothetical protein